MREQLIKYVELLFAGAPDSTEIKQEILQNTLDRYDDLVSQGKQPEAAYRLAIGGIGDINEILGTDHGQKKPEPVHAERTPIKSGVVPLRKKILRAVGVCLYILCPIPLFILADTGLDTLGLSGMLVIVAIATALMIISGGGDTSAREENQRCRSEAGLELRKAVKVIITTLGLIAYFALSIATKAWYITWLVFPIMGAVQGLVKAILDLKEADKV